MAPARHNESILSRCLSFRGVSRTTSISLRPSFKVTSATRAASVSMLHGTMTIPLCWKELVSWRGEEQVGEAPDSWYALCLILMAIGIVRR
jgi:hypothetical protein